MRLITPRENPVAIPAKLIPESIVNATALGVDVWGPVPDDATKGDGFYTATPGTLGWAWIRAQQDLGSYEEDVLESRGLLPSAAVEKRQTTSILLKRGPYKGDRSQTWHGTINGPTQAGICWQIASTTCFEMKQT
ncbi:uncharacterized protein QC761_116110 [Podospora bellae-mahoneyi]|uniref:Uncharacterized protein n=1 Tax=Podospora bellae-mahoneyi TaxID=2093777 RepID=A0ABR0G060_9PEZI|nr:hypothetical protein QC761_116110 [Podospora bellae-mahoneyi]